MKIIGIIAAAAVFSLMIISTSKQAGATHDAVAAANAADCVVVTTGGRVRVECK